jgi:hypothetical protein
VILLLLECSFPVQIYNVQFVSPATAQRPELWVHNVVQNALLDAAVLRFGSANVESDFVRSLGGLGVRGASRQQVRQVAREFEQLGRERWLYWSLFLF